MKVELFPFQKVALAQLRQSVVTAMGNYQSTNTPQIVSYTAPTGAGKTIIMSALIESIYCGDERYPDQSDAIFIWLSDSPQLNEQSKMKIDLKADKIQLGQCVVISDDSFDMEVLEDGHIYFLNTQKLSKSSNLTKHSDGRQYTIWETIANTVCEKSDRLYFIIDEAHRGAQKPSDLKKNTTIMQKFLKGSSVDRLPPMPVVIGMTATPQRFKRLAEEISSTTHYVKTDTEDVRASGLLKDRIVVRYSGNDGNDMGVLQAATGEWVRMCEHWYQYCYEQHYGQVNPIFVIQVQNGNSHRVSMTDLDECLRVVEDCTGEHFLSGQVVHSFGEGVTTIRIGGLDVPYCEPSRIFDDKRIKVVFFKETLSTVWDCPRAEVMMSFRHAVDYTYIAQLLGRMIRTPTQQRINVDESLNDVYLFLPQFDRSTAEEVVKALRGEEGATIPSDIDVDEIGSDNYDLLGLKPTYKTPPHQSASQNPREQMSIFDATDSRNEIASHPVTDISDTNKSVLSESAVLYSTPNTSGASIQRTQTTRQTGMYESHSSNDVPLASTVIDQHTIDRESIVKAINSSGLLTYHVRKVRINDYQKSMYALARLLTLTGIDVNAQNSIISDVTGMIHDHIETLKQNDMYDILVNKVSQFELNTQVFDVFGRAINIDDTDYDLLSTTDADIERQCRLADKRLGSEGIAYNYVKRYYDDADLINLKIHVIIFAADANCISNLNDYAREKFHEMNDLNRRRTIGLPDRFKKQYDDIVSNGDIVSKHNFCLPEIVRVPHESDGILYRDHLYVDDFGTALIKLNEWERKVIVEEESRDDFVCWLRNPSRGSWALCIPYEINGETKPAYPDFLIVRRDGSGYVIDVLEPHDPTRIDNLGKAKGFAEYARQNPGVGRIQLIRMRKNSIGQEQAFRLDMSKSVVRDKVFHCCSNDELDHVFESDGCFQ